MFKFFTSDLRRNIIKILCLAVGLAVGFLLVAKIYFEQSYDSFFPDVDRIYMIRYSAVHNGEYEVYPNTPGGVVPEVKRNVSQVEVATRFTQLTDEPKVKLNDGRTYEMPYVYLADSCFFDVFKTEIIEGNPHEALAVKDQVMIPQSLADKIGGNVVGKQLSVFEWGDDYKMTIGGVYKDFPLNSTISNSIYLSLPTIGKFMMDGTENLWGNDRYQSYALLSEGSNPEIVTDMMYQHLKTKIDEDAFKLYDLKVVLVPLSGNYSSQAGVRNMSWMLGLLALIMLMCAGLNYLLIVIGQLSTRGKEMAIRKCYGTGRKSIFKLMMTESLFFLLVSLMVAVLISFSFSDLCKELLGYTPKELFSTGKVWIVEGLVCLALLIITGIIPSIIYGRTPVSQAFRPAVHGRKVWKLVLLAVQFTATGLIICLLVLVGRQYAMIGKIDMGLDYENIGIFYRYPMSAELTSTVMKELKKLPFVEEVATANNDPTQWPSGNNIWTEGNEEDNVNISDQEYVNPEFFDVFGIEFLQGSNFSENLDSTVNQIVVDERMIKVLQKYFGETDDDIIGKSIYVTGHGDGGLTSIFTIVGVVGNIRRGGFESGSTDTRAEVFFPSQMNMEGFSTPAR